MQIADGVFLYRGRSGKQLGRGAGTVNVVIVRGATLAAVDAGVVAGGAFRDLLGGVATDQLNLRDLAWIAHTHCHWDHINATAALQQMSSAKLAAGASDLPLIEDSGKNFRSFVDGLGPLVGEVFPYPRVLARLFIWYAWGRQPRLRVDRGLADGEVIDVGRRIEAVALPGHTIGHMGYYVPDAGLLALGDLIDYENAYGMDLNNPRSDYASGVRSLERALSLDVEVLIPAHGEPTTGKARVQALLNRALAGAHRYREEIRVALGTRPLRLRDIATRVFPDVPFTMQAMTMMLVLVVLSHLEKTGHAKRVSHAGHPTWVRDAEP